MRPQRGRHREAKRVRGPGVVPQLVRVRQVSRELGLRGDRRDSIDVLGDVAAASALRDEAPAGAQRRPEAVEETLVIGDPVEGRGREDQVDRLLDAESTSIPQLNCGLETSS